MTRDDAARLYRAIRSRSHETDPRRFDAMVEAVLGIGPHTPAAYVQAAERVKVPCKRCASSGRFVTGMVNGQPTGPGGPCYRCDAKGYQTDADCRRNYGADLQMVARAARQMMGGG